ncbi:MAG: hypothetical protein VKO21_04935 [Candidatus Sericytochromatia bacterium]|nr:hypothetical protein [Candidatus Sericytochromatia bacterium]
MPAAPQASRIAPNVLRRMNPGDPVSRRHEERLVAVADYVVLDRGQDRLLLAGCNLPLRGREIGAQVRVGGQNATIVALEDKALLAEFERNRVRRWLGQPAENLATGGAALGAATLGQKLGSLMGKGGAMALLAAAGAAVTTKVLLTRRTEGPARADAEARDKACQNAVRESALDTVEAPTVLRR